MTDRAKDCEGRHDDLAAYALDALDAREAALLEHHLAECPVCEERLQWLMPAIDVLPVTVAQQDPPPALRDRLMAVVEAEAEAEGAAARAPAPRRRFRMPLFGELSLRPALAGLGVAVIIAAGVAGWAVRDGSGTGTDTRTYAAKPLSGKSLASGTLEVNGDEGSLAVRNLPPTHKGEVYQAWVQDPSGPGGGAIHPSSVFVVSQDGTGTVAIPSGLSHAARVMVTREPKGGSEVPGESALISAEIR
jgi:hypothetical protein